MEKIDTFLRAMISFSQYGSIARHDFKRILDNVRDDISDEIYFILKGISFVIILKLFLKIV